LLNQHLGELSEEKSQMQGIEGPRVTLGITISLLVEAGPHLLYHQFVTMEAALLMHGEGIYWPNYRQDLS